MPFTQLLQLEEIEPHRLYRGASKTNLQRAFGGQVLAGSLLTAYESVGEDRLAHSLHAYFLRPGRTDMPILYDVESTREGRSFSSRRVIARQNGTNIFQLSASFHVHEDGYDHGDVLPPAPEPQDCPPLSEVLAAQSGTSPERFEQEWGILDVRFAGDSSRAGGIEAHSHGAHLRVWVRTRHPLPPDTRWHHAALAYLSDLTLFSVSTVPHPAKVGSAQIMAASIDHSMWFHRPCAADEWILYDQISPSASNALGFSSGRMFQGGRLVASCTQEGLIRLVDPPRGVDGDTP